MSQSQGDGPCPQCGFDPTAPHHPLYLKAGTPLSKRFLAGKLLRYNGEGVSYLGYDLALNQKVVIREYMPDVLAVREKGGINVLVLKGRETQYKALLSDFCDLCRTLQKLRTYTGLVPVLDFFEMNNTAYAIYAYTGDTALASYLKQNGPMTAQQLRTKMIPVFAALEAMHATGIFHRGISPTAIYVNEEDDFQLGGFCIAAARTAKSELAAELFPGYSPPELYSLTGWQGSWTDVYALAAVSYTALTGLALPDAAQREVRDTLESARAAVPSISVRFADALQAAMRLDPKERTQTVGAFAGAFSQPAAAMGDSSSPEHDVLEHSEKRGEEMNKEQQPQKKQQRAIKRKVRTRSLLYMLGSMFITTTILLTLMFVILNEIDSSLLVFAKEKKPQSSTLVEVVSDGGQDEKPYYIPNFVGSYFDTVKSSEDYMVRYAVTETEEYNEDYPVGVIFEQDPAADSPAKELINVAVKVSKGPAPIPEDIVGMSQTEAERILGDLKVKYEIAQVYDNTYPNGYVVGYTRLPGEIMLKVSQGSMDGYYNSGDSDDDMTYEEKQEWLYH